MPQDNPNHAEPGASVKGDNIEPAVRRLLSQRNVARRDDVPPMHLQEARVGIKEKILAPKKIDGWMKARAGTSKIDLVIMYLGGLPENGDSTQIRMAKLVYVYYAGAEIDFVIITGRTYGITLKTVARCPRGNLSK